MRRYLILSLTVILIIFFIQSPWTKNAARPMFLFQSKVIHGTLNGIGGFFSFLFHIGRVNEENELLKNRLNEVETQNSIYKARISEIERTKKYETRFSNLLLSNVIGRDPGNWFKTVFIDKGENDGIRTNMVVLLSSGTVGRVIETSPSYSTVLLAIDRGSKIAVVVRETRELGIAEGMENSVQMNFFTRNIEAKPGDMVLTSGMGGTFPKGLVLGKITQVGKSGLVAKADIEPAVDFNRLEEVLVLIR
jgi:rod shape-determining protein MreC